MDVSQMGAAQQTKNIEIFSLFALFNEVENSALNQMKLSQTQQDYYKETSADAA